MRRAAGINVLVAIVTVSPATVAMSDVLEVPGDFASVTAAVTAAQAGDEIVVSNGTWAAALDFGGKQLLLRSAFGPEVTTLTMPRFTSGSVVSIDGVGSAGSSIEGFTLTGGLAPSGGGLSVTNGATVSIVDCIFVGNEAILGNGGGAYVASDSLADFTGCIFRGNVAAGEGGGLSLEADGGFIVDGCRFEGNDAGGNGGGAAVGAETVLDEGESFPRILNSIFSGNVSGAAGGGAYVYAARIACPFKGPDICRAGGAYGCTFSSNVAETGGAIDGGRPFEFGNAIDVVNCILKGNLGDYGTADLGGVEVPLLPDFLHSCVDVISAEAAAPSGSIVAEPRFVSEFGPDGDAGTGDEVLQLLPGSPAVDAGYVYAGASSVLNGSQDVGGDSRIVNSIFSVDTGVREGPFPGPIVDMGAHEFVDSGVLGSIAVWIGDGGAFDGVSNWFGGETPDLSLATWLDGPDDSETMTTLAASTTIGEMYVNSGVWSIQGTDSGVVRSLTVGVEGPMGKEPGTLYLGAYAGQRASLRLENLDLACEQIVVARGDFEVGPSTDGPEVEVNAGSVIIATDGDTGLASVFRARGTVDTIPVGVLPSFWNLGVTEPSGPLAIDGNYYQSGGVTFPGIIGRLRFDLSDPGQSVSVSGRAVLGGPVEFIVDADEPPSVEAGDTFAVMTAADGFNGTEFALATTTGLGDGLFLTLTTNESVHGPGSSVVATVNSASELLLGSETTGGTDAVADLVVEDIDGDGAADLVLSVPDAVDPTGVAGDVVVLLNQGSTGGGWDGFESFGSAISVEVGVLPAGLDAGDLDGDDDIDIAVANRVDGTVTILLNDGNDPPGFTSFDLDSSPTLAGSADPLDVYIGNLDSEGLPDLVVTNAVDGLAVAFKNQTSFAGGGFGGMDGGTESDPGTAITKFDPGDADGKDREDRVVGTSKVGNSTKTSSSSSGVGGGIALSWSTDPVGAGPVDVARGFLDADTQEDVVTVNEDGGTISILLGDGTGFVAASTIVVGDNPVAVDVGDLDGDGDDDIAVVCENLNGQRVLRTVQNMREESGQFSLLVLANDALAGQAPTLLKVADVDGDGTIADAVTILSASALHGGRIDGFAALLGLGDQPPCVGDINGDGLVDAADLGQLIGDWGQAGERPTDLNEDLLVDAADLGLLIAGWGACPGSR